MCVNESDGVVHLVVLIRTLDRMIKKALRALKDYDTAQAQLESIVAGGGDAAFDTPFGLSASNPGASDTHKRNLSVQQVLTMLDVHAQHIYLYFYLIENALQVRISYHITTHITPHPAHITRLQQQQ